MTLTAQEHFPLVTRFTLVKPLNPGMRSDCTPSLQMRTVTRTQCTTLLDSLDLLECLHSSEQHSFAETSEAAKA